jgi:magnesium transporter
LIRYFVHRGGRTELVDRLDPAWLLPPAATPAASSGADAGVIVWADVAEPTDEDGKVLREQFGLHELAVEAAFQRETNPKVEPYDRYLYIVLHGINFDASEHRFETHETDFFLSPRFLVTVHDGQRRSIAHISDVCTRRA